MKNDSIIMLKSSSTIKGCVDLARISAIEDADKVSSEVVNEATRTQRECEQLPAKRLERTLCTCLKCNRPMPNSAL
jgi:hypothetical protein